MPWLGCRICKAKFYAEPFQIRNGWGKFCSVACRHESQKKGKFLSCPLCGRKFWRTPRHLRASKSRRYFCSKSCQTKWRNQRYSGENLVFWKGGENVYRKKMLDSNRPRYCLLCGEGDLRVLEIHHVDKNRLNNTHNNLAWLCMNCHHLVHRHQVNISMRA